MRAIKTAFFQMLLFLRKDMMLFAALLFTCFNRYHLQIWNTSSGRNTEQIYRFPFDPLL